MVMQNYGINKVHYGLCEPKAKPQEIDAQETDQTEEHVFVRVFEAKYILYKKNFGQIFQLKPTPEMNCLRDLQ